MGKEDIRVLVVEDYPQLLNILNGLDLSPHVVLKIISNAPEANKHLLDIIDGDEPPYDIYCFDDNLNGGRINRERVKELVESSDDDKIKIYDISLAGGLALLVDDAIETLFKTGVIELIENIPDESDK